jgi:S-adenosylmethionine decarboxylase proenzyme
MELWGCDPRVLDDEQKILDLLNKGALASGSTPVFSRIRHFDPQGVTGILMVEESHFSVHTWPEAGYAAMDAYTCGDCDPMRAVEIFKDGLKAQKVEVKEIIRGVQPLVAVS